MKAYLLTLFTALALSATGCYTAKKDGVRVRIPPHFNTNTHGLTLFSRE